jgi:hypothetical protein
MGLLAPKNRVVGTSGTRSVLPTIGTTVLVSVLPIKTLWQLKIRLSVLPGQGRKYPPINQLAKQPQTFDRRISQTTLSLETKFWGRDEHHKERLCPKNYGLKLLTTPGIANPCQEHYDLGFIQKSTNRRPIRHLRGQDRPQRGTRHSPMTPSKEIRRETPSNRWIERRTKNPRKGSENHRKREMRGATRTHEESRQTFYTHHERFIQGIACLLNIHPSLKISPWSSQASPMEDLRKIGSENSKGKWARVSRDGCHPLFSKYIWRQSKDETTPIT